VPSRRDVPRGLRMRGRVSRLKKVWPSWLSTRWATKAALRRVAARRGGARASCGHRYGGLRGRQGCRDRARSGGSELYADGVYTFKKSVRHKFGEMIALYQELDRSLPNRLDRGWVGRGRLGRWQAHGGVGQGAAGGYDIFCTNMDLLSRGIRRAWRMPF